MKWLAILVVPFVIHNAFADDQSGNNFLVGNWTWTRDVNHCTESYTFREDGTASVISGEEKSDLKYALSGTVNSNGRRPLSLITVKDHGGKDCEDSTEDNTGKLYSVYVEFSHAKTEMKICHESVGGKCYGPLHKAEDAK